MPGLNSKNYTRLFNVYRLLANVDILYDENCKSFSIKHGQLLNSTDVFSNQHTDTEIFAFPGLINSHDHLEFNLFPLLARHTYGDYKEWASDIHQYYKKEIKQILNLPLPLRVGWGILKNILNGITTIVHHGGYHRLINQFNYPVFLHYQYIHSISYEKNWKLKLNYPWFQKDVMVHIGEGTSPEMTAEIDNLIKWNLFKRNLIGIHAIQILPKHAKHFKAIIWCPDSNIYLYGKGPVIDKVKHLTTIVFGTDSNLSASSNMWQQVRVARGLGMLSDEELFYALTRNPKQVFKLNHRQTSGNWVIAKRTHTDLPLSFYSLNPEDILLVIVNYKVVLADAAYIACIDQGLFQPIRVGRAVKWLPLQWSQLVSELEQLNVSLPLNVSSLRHIPPR
ncbi:hypothetical protein GXP67_04455 [Rhodocytophaga rosea]|uniref:Amidohydrolase family protein n=1 Tax=Rhodocytophaga rosea TaxID=2704465 RepID=A0A6C0GDS2_9BACT|nr:hypothetical protein [Rhodocytophaga rosea]QHT65974.1 hypothetical protein GXP67_04455 [Rhodocytophaga rosea]